MTALRTVEFRVIGDPKPQGSKRHVGHGILVESAGAPLADWRSAVAAAAAVQANKTGTFNAPIAAVLRFYLRRPKGARAGVLWQSKRPDVDKLTRAVFDALTTGGLVGDDSHIAHLVACKMYATDGWTGCEISLSEMAP